MRILLVEDEPELAATLVRRLAGEGFVVDHVPSLAQAAAAAMVVEYRAIVLDRRLPDGDGLALLPLLRTRAVPPPALVLSALGEIPDRVAGLDSGADDYLAKPFAFAELLARLRVLLRRGASPAGPAPVTVGRLRYDLVTREPQVAGASLKLTRRERAILDALVRRAGRVMLREHLEAQVYGFDDSVSPNALEAHVSRLRRRLADADAGVVVHGIRGVGYMLDAA